MDMILNYIDQHMEPLCLLFCSIVFAAVCLLLYLRERSRAAQTEALVLGERGFYRSFAVNRQDFFMLVGRSDLHIHYISPNFEALTGLDTERVCLNFANMRFT